jgi:hypothetical protein
MHSRLTARLVVLTLGLALAGNAGAASVSIYPQYESGSGPTAVFCLYVANSLSVGVGSVLLGIEGVGGTFNPDPANTGISLVDTAFSVNDVGWDAVLMVNGLLSPAGVISAIAPAGAVTRLGSFLPGQYPRLFPGEYPDPTDGQQYFEATFYDLFGNPVLGTTFISAAPPYPCPGECLPLHGVTVVVPESAWLGWLAALSAAGRCAATARRSARRRNA